MLKRTVLGRLHASVTRSEPRYFAKKKGTDRSGRGRLFLNKWPFPRDGLRAKSSGPDQFTRSLLSPKGLVALPWDKLTHSYHYQAQKALNGSPPPFSFYLFIFSAELIISPRNSFFY
jgi:hypothetical protein